MSEKTPLSSIVLVAPLPVVTRLFHWVTVGLVVSMFCVIWAASLAGPGFVGASLVNLHRSVGVTLFFVVLARLIWRLTHPYPSLPASVPNVMHWVVGGVHVALYAALLAMPLIGWIASDMAGDTVRVFGLFKLPSIFEMNTDRSDLLFALHGWVATTLLAAMALHISGALRHHFILRDGVTRRMFK